MVNWHAVTINNTAVTSGYASVSGASEAYCVRVCVLFFHSSFCTTAENLEAENHNAGRGILLNLYWLDLHCSLDMAEQHSEAQEETFNL